MELQRLPPVELLVPTCLHCRVRRAVPPAAHQQRLYTPQVLHLRCLSYAQPNIHPPPACCSAVLLSFCLCSLIPCRKFLTDLAVAACPQGNEQYWPSAPIKHQLTPCLLPCCPAVLLLHLDRRGYGRMPPRRLAPSRTCCWAGQQCPTCRSCWRQWAQEWCC